MAIVGRIYTKGFFVVPGLTALLFLAGIIVLPGLGSWVDLAQAQTEPVRAEAPAVTHNTWTSGAPLPVAVVAASAGVVKGEIYVVGGENAAKTTIADVQVYNPATNTWRAVVSLPTPLEVTSAAVVKNVLYIFGGNTGTTVTNTAWAYNSKTKTWTAMANMPTARENTTAVVEKNIIYVIGGVDSNVDFVGTVESYNPATNTWTEEAAMSGAKQAPAAGLLGTTIVAADGATQPGQITGDTEGYNAATNTWTELSADPTARVFSCSGSIGPKLYDAGGYLNNAGAAATVNESFQLSKNNMDNDARCDAAGNDDRRVRSLQRTAVLHRRLEHLGRDTCQQCADLSAVEVGRLVGQQFVPGSAAKPHATGS